MAVLESVGGFDIAGMCGLMLGGAIYRIPVVLDGLISLMAALLAQKFCPLVTDFLLPSHMGKEPACGMAMEKLGLEASIYGNLALGEGTGAVMLFPLLDMAEAVYRENSTFEVSMWVLTRILKKMRRRKQHIRRRTVLKRRNRHDLFYRSRTWGSGTHYRERKTPDR